MSPSSPPVIRSPITIVARLTSVPFSDRSYMSRSYTKPSSPGVILLSTFVNVLPMLIRLVLGSLVRAVMWKSIHRGKSGEFLIRLKSIMKRNQVRNIQGAYNMIKNIFLGDTTDDFVRIVQSFTTKRQRQQLIGLVASDEAPDKIERYIEAYTRVRVENNGQQECMNISSSLSPEECRLLLDTLYPNEPAFRQAVANYNTADNKKTVDDFLKETAQQLNTARNIVGMSSGRTTTVLPARLRQEIMSGADMLARDKITGEMNLLWGHDALQMLAGKGILQTIQRDMTGVDDVTKHLIGVVLAYAIDIDENMSAEVNDGVFLRRPTLALQAMTVQLDKTKGRYFEDTTTLRGFVAFLIVYVVVEIVTLLYDCVHVGAAVLAFYTENLRWLSVYTNYASFKWKKFYPEDRPIMHVMLFLWVIKFVGIVWLIKWYIQLLRDILPSIFPVPRIVEEDDNIPDQQLPPAGGDVPPPLVEGDAPPPLIEGDVPPPVDGDASV